MHRIAGIRRVAAAAVAAAALLALLALPSTGAATSSAPTPWNGVNPYRCAIQNAGTGTAVPDPGADPYCVEFDKTNQNISQLGMVTFLLNEPARTAAAVPKCFYFQEDHWRGSVVQSDGATEIYEFIGHYFFNKATGDGGVWVTDFNVNGHTFDPTQLPGFPPSDGQYFGPGTGGVITHNDVPVDPQCAALAASTPGGVYATSEPQAPQCTADTGQIDGHGLGPVALDASDQTVRDELGIPAAIRRGFLRYCVTGGGAVLVGEPGDRSGTFGPSSNAKAVLIATTASGFTLVGRRGRAVHVGARTRSLHNAFPHARQRQRQRQGQLKRDHLRLWRLSPSIVALAGGGRIRCLAVYDPSAIRSNRALANYLIRAR